MLSPKVQRILHWVIAGGLVLSFTCGMCERCVNMRRLKKAETAYSELQKQTAEAQKVSDAIIAAKAAEAAKALAKADALAVENAGLREQVSAQAVVIADLQANEPPTTPEIEALPVVIHLRAQVKALTQGFTLAQQTIAQQDAEIRELRLVIVDQKIMLSEWEAKFNREQALRLSSESLSATYRREIGRLRLNGTVKTVVLGGLAAGLVYSMVK